MVTMIVFITNVVFGELISLFGYDVRAKCTSSVSKEIVALRNNIWTLENTYSNKVQNSEMSGSLRLLSLSRADPPAFEAAF